MMTWRKASYSGAGGTEECVEVARLSETIAVRDSKNPEAEHLELPHHAFAALLDHLKSYRPTT
ncbi:DUF397 domain-containing protein [Actinomadura sp. NPDC048394]|jgi:hypothetical protein|uniref:DUF397 domain-containing protein n=1 Tax=Actinomadura sp. NPDC048394 TaxID=3158223 RepID=UPI0033CD11F0